MLLYKPGSGAGYLIAARTSGQVMFCTARASVQVICALQGHRGKLFFAQQGHRGKFFFCTAKSSGQVIIFLRSKCSGTGYFNGIGAWQGHRRGELFLFKVCIYLFIIFLSATYLPLYLFIIHILLITSINNCNRDQGDRSIFGNFFDR